MSFETRRGADVYHHPRVSRSPLYQRSGWQPWDQPTLASASAGRSRAMPQLANDPASSPPVSARITPTATAEGLTCTDIGTAAVWLATTVVTDVRGAVSAFRSAWRRFR